MADTPQQSESEREPQAGIQPIDLGTCAVNLENASAKWVADVVAPYDLVFLDFALLKRFLRQEEWTSTQLAQILPVDASRISRLVTKLVDRGLLRRRRLRSDRRVVKLTLTEQGKALTRDLHRRVQAYEARVTEGISDEEMAAFLSTAYKILANYDAMARSKPE